MLESRRDTCQRAFPEGQAHDVLVSGHLRVGLGVQGLGNVGALAVGSKAPALCAELTGQRRWPASHASAEQQQAHSRAWQGVGNGPGNTGRAPRQVLIRDFITLRTLVAECWAAHMVRTHQRPVRRLYAPFCKPQGRALLADRQWMTACQTQHGMHTQSKHDC